MTDQERQLLQNLIQRVRNAPPPQIDREADEMIRSAIGSQPDALYILVQSVLIQEMALKQAKAQIDELKQQPVQTSFLGAPGTSSGSGYGNSRYQQEAAAPPPQQYLQEQPRSGFSGFLHNAAQTAAGIVAGEVAFSALSSLFGHHQSYGGGYGGGMGSGFLGGVGGGETVVNNYYEGGNEHPLEHGLSPDLEDRRFASSDDTSDIASGDDSTFDDTATDDDSSYDDGSDSTDV